MQAREDARERALEAEREQEHQRQLAEERAGFIEETARAWQDSRELTDRDAAKVQQDRLTRDVASAAERYGMGFDDLAAPINARADEMKTERAQQREIEAARE